MKIIGFIPPTPKKPKSEPKTDPKTDEKKAV